MTIPRSLRLLAVALLLPSPREALACCRTNNTPPTVKVEILTGTEVDENSEVRVRVTVDDANGDNVSARLIDGPPRMWMAPIVNQPPSAVREFTWFGQKQAGGYWRIVVEAHDARDPSVLVRGQASFHMSAFRGPGTMLVDLDSDGNYELVARDPNGNAGGVSGAGELCAYTAGIMPVPPAPPAPPPSQTLPPPLTPTPSPFALERLVAFEPNYVDGVGAAGYVRADVNGDGVDDLLAPAMAHGGSIQIWLGLTAGLGATMGATIDRPADAVLSVNSTAGVFTLGDLHVADVTGDGLNDIIVGDEHDSSVAPNAGRIVVFAGSRWIAGKQSPIAVLQAGSPQPDDEFGAYVRIGDVTGDGIADIVTAAPHADMNGIVDEGCAAVFAGGRMLSGALTPKATLLGRPAAGSLFGQVTGAFGLYLVDLNGDGVSDVLVGASDSNVNGEMYYWAGGSALNGTPAATATLVDSRSGYSSHLGVTPCGDGIQFADLNHDGFLDVVAADSGAKKGNGLIKMWAGGPTLTGTVGITASFGDTVTQKTGQALTACEQGWRIVDVTADGIPDVVAIAPSRKVGNNSYVGSAFVWAGAQGLSGTPAPTATLVVNGASANDVLGLIEGQNEGAGMQIADVTGDGIVDIVIPATFANEGGIVDAGAIYVFKGGSTLTGTVNPLARLVGLTPSAGDRIAHSSYYSFMTDFPYASFVIADVTGDGINDVVSSARDADHAGITDTGAIYVWDGGAAMTGTRVPRAQFYGAKQDADLGRGAAGFALGDEDDDGILDVVALEYGTGKAYVLRGGATLQGTVAPARTLNTLVSPTFVGAGGSPDLLFLDLNADGHTDLLAPSPFAQSSAGVLVWWKHDDDSPVQLFAPTVIPGIGEFGY